MFFDQQASNGYSTNNTGTLSQNTMPSIPQRSMLDEKTWLREFSAWADHNQSLVDTLNPDFFKPIIEAASQNNIEFKLFTLASIYKFIDSDDAAAEGLKDFIELLELENQTC